MTGTAIFDRALLRRRRARAATDFAAHDFLFRHVAREIADRLQAVLRDFPLALDLGAHHGLVGRAVAALPRVGQVVYAEPSEPFARACPQPALVAEEELLPFADKSLDLVVSGLALHLVNDLPGTLIQVRRALKPDGLFTAALLGGETLLELREVLMEAEIETRGGAGPRVAPFTDIRDAGGLLQRANFALPVVDSEAVSVTYRGLTPLLRELRGMGGSNVLLDRDRTPLSRATLSLAERLYRARYPGPEGRIAARFEILYLSGWAPHDSQQRPLAPGSARMRLADALHTVEQTAGEKAPQPRYRLDRKADD